MKHKGKKPTRAEKEEEPSEALNALFDDLVGPGPENAAEGCLKAPMPEERVPKGFLSLQVFRYLDVGGASTFEASLEVDGEVIKRVGPTNSPYETQEQRTLMQLADYWWTRLRQGRRPR